VAREIPMMLLATVATVVMSADTFFDGTPRILTRSDGLVLLLLFSVFLYYTIGELLRQRADHPVLEEFMGDDIPGVGTGVAIARDTLLALAGFGALLYGADLTVEGAVAIARDFGVSEVAIGMGVVAIGTSLPELAAGLMATIRGHMELAIGNVVGSNVFNLLLVLAVTACIRPLEIPALGLLDLGFTVLLSLALLVVSMTNHRQILRAEAGLLLTAYAGYITWRVTLL
jgi:cation:H+ antiporter